MANGRSFILVAVAVTIASAALTAGLLVAWEWLGARGVGLRAGVLFAAMGLALGLIVFACIRRLQAVVRRLGIALEESAGGASQQSINVPWWLRELAEAVTTVAASFESRAASANARLRESEIRLRLSEVEREHTLSILNSLRDAVIVTDGFNEITSTNTRAAELFEALQAESERPRVREVLGPTQLDTAISEALASGVPNKRTHLERAIASEHGEAVYDVTLATLPDPDRSGVSGVVTILRDVTREKEISRMKTDFVSQASHELRTPISSINAYIEMLMDGDAADEETRAEFYGIIKAEADRVARLVDNMLNISRIESGIQRVEPTNVDFVQVCEEVAGVVARSAEQKNIRVSTKSGPLIYTAEADRDMMTQVVLNLVSNAIKYTPEGGRVTLEVDTDDATRCVLVSVQDTGLGIPPEAIEKVFEKFYRIDSYKRVAKGTGLGLNLVKHIVETMHHGRVGVESEVGMGSRFWFAVPYAHGAEDARGGDS